MDQIQRSTAKAAAITRQLLVFSRKQVLHLHPMDLHAALSEAQSQLSHLLGSDIEVIFSAEAGSSWISSDSPQVVQIIRNLSSNSRDAVPHSGQLLISTRNTDKPPAIAAPAAAKIPEWIVR